MSKDWTKEFFATDDKVTYVPSLKTSTSELLEEEESNSIGHKVNVRSPISYPYSSSKQLEF